MLNTSIRKQFGLSLIEILISLAIAVLLLSAAATMGLASLGSSKNAIINTNAQQELQITLNLLTKEIRRAGYNFDSENTPSNFRKIWFFNPDSGTETNYKCVVFIYDKNPESSTSSLIPPGNGTIETGDIRGFRFIDNRIDIYTPSTVSMPTSCPTSDWQALTTWDTSADAKNTGLKITSLTFNPTKTLLSTGYFVVDDVNITINAQDSNTSPFSVNEKIQLRNRPAFKKAI